MKQYKLSADEQWPTLVMQETHDGEAIPTRLVNRLNRAHTAVMDAEDEILRHVGLDPTNWRGWERTDK